MSYIHFTTKATPPGCIPSEWENFFTHCTQTIPGWDDMTMREADRAVNEVLKAYNGWMVDDEMDQNGISPTVWSLRFATEKDAVAFVLRWS